MATKRKTRLGRVVSNKMDKTIVVAVETSRRHPIYKKTIRKTTKYKAHDEKNECGLGDTVRLVETRPLSKEKRWRVAEIISRAEVIEVKPEEIAVEPEALGIKPEVVEEKPEEAEAKVEVAEAEPEEAEAKPEEVEAEPKEAEAKAEEVEAKAEETDEN